MKIKPIGANQTEFQYEYPGYEKTMLFSYETPVACILDGTAFKTDKYWSKTTTKHINQWLKQYDHVEVRPQDFFNGLVGGV